MSEVKNPKTTMAVEIAEMRKDLEFLTENVKKVLAYMEQQQGHVLICERKNDLKYVQKDDLKKEVIAILQKVKDESINRSNALMTFYTSIAKLALPFGVGYLVINYFLK